jgi:hypothetical protein
VRCAINSFGLEPGRRSLGCLEEIGATPGVGLSVRRLLAVTGEHVVDSCRYGHGLAARADGLVCRGQGIAQRVLQTVEFPERVVQPSVLCDRRKR